jgi:hypothetical protein
MTLSAYARERLKAVRAEVSQRNERIVALRAEGKAYKEIAAGLGLPQSTVANVCRKVAGYARPGNGKVSPRDSNGDVHFSYQRPRTLEEDARYRATQESDSAHVAHLRAGIAEFRRMLEQRYGPAPRLRKIIGFSDAVGA